MARVVQVVVQANTDPQAQATIITNHQAVAPPHLNIRPAAHHQSIQVRHRVVPKDHHRAFHK